MDYNYAMEALAILTPYENFLYGLKVPETKRQYPHRLDKFMCFIGLEAEGGATIQQRTNVLYDMGKNNPALLQLCVIRFIDAQKQRIADKEITEGTTCQLHKGNQAILFDE